MGCMYHLHPTKHYYSTPCSNVRRGGLNGKRCFNTWKNRRTQPRKLRSDNTERRRRPEVGRSLHLQCVQYNETQKGVVGTMDAEWDAIILLYYTRVPSQWFDPLLLADKGDRWITTKGAEDRRRKHYLRRNGSITIVCSEKISHAQTRSPKSSDFRSMRYGV